MNYLTNYYRNLSEQLQQQVNVFQSQLNEYLVRTGEKDGKKGTWYGPRFQADEDRPNIDFDKRYFPKIKRNEYDYVLPDFDKLKSKPYLPYSERTGEENSSTFLKPNKPKFNSNELHDASDEYFDIIKQSKDRLARNKMKDWSDSNEMDRFGKHGDEIDVLPKPEYRPYV
jgi:hypothetical protein